MQDVDCQLCHAQMVEYARDSPSRSSICCRSGSAEAAPKQPTEQTVSKLLCGPDCQNDIKSIEETKTASGLRYKDIKVGAGPIPPVGYQVRRPLTIFISALRKASSLNFRDCNVHCLICKDVLSRTGGDLLRLSR